MASQPCSTPPEAFATSAACLGAISVTALKPGDRAVLCDRCLDEAMDQKDAAMLRAMGLRPQATVRLCRLGEPCIIEVMSAGVEGCGDTCRIGLARTLADRVMVKPPEREAAPLTRLTTSARREA